MKVSFTNYEYILLYLQNTTLKYEIIFEIIIQNSGQRMAPPISAPGRLSMLSPSLASSFELEQILLVPLAFPVSGA